MFNIYERNYGVRTETDKELNTPDIENKTEARLLRGMTIDKTDTEKKIDKLKKDINGDIEDIKEEVQGQNETIGTLTEQIEQIPTLIEQYLDQYVNSLEIASFQFNTIGGSTGDHGVITVRTGIKRKDMVSLTTLANNTNILLTIQSITDDGVVTINYSIMSTTMGSTGELLVLHKGINS